MKFLDLITSADPRQHVNRAAHHLGHTLDLLITRLDDKLISQVRTLPELLSDLNVVACDINLPSLQHPVGLLAIARLVIPICGLFEVI